MGSKTLLSKFLFGSSRGKFSKDDGFLFVWLTLVEFRSKIKLRPSQVSDIAQLIPLILEDETRFTDREV